MHLHAPRQYRVADHDRLWALMRARPFATLVTAGSDGDLRATRLISVVDEPQPGRPRLRAHLAYANAQARELVDGARVLLLFDGPHAYISSRWYPEPGEPPEDPPVPTWDYAHVQARGRARVLADDEALAVVVDTARAAERSLGDPIDVPGDHPEYRSLIRGIVAFEVLDVELEGSWKLSQNRTPGERERVVAGLRATAAGAPPESALVADLVEDPLRPVE
jgi:transcriptional regulator